MNYKIDRALQTLRHQEIRTQLRLTIAEKLTKYQTNSKRSKWVITAVQTYKILKQMLEKLEKARQVRQFQQNFSLITMRLNMGLKSLVQRSGPTYESRIQRSSKVALSLLGLVAVEVKEVLEEPRCLIAQFLFESDLKLQMIDKMKMFARLNLGRSEELENIETKFALIRASQQ